MQPFAASDISDPADGVVYEDIPAFFPAGAETLFGVLTRPTGEWNGTTVTMLTGGGYITSTHRNRLYVTLARRLAVLGYQSLRFDYHGTGESTGAVEEFSLDQPFSEDVRGALRWLEAREPTKHVLIGSCFGARTVLSCSPGLAALAGAILISPPVRDFSWDPGTRQYVSAGQPSAGDEESAGAMPISPAFLLPFSRLVQDKVPVLFVYGASEGFYEDFRQASAGGLRPILDDAGALVEVRTLPGNVHQFRSLDVQHAVLEVMVEWLSNRQAGPALGT